MAEFLGTVKTGQPGCEISFKFFIEDEELELLEDHQIKEIAMEAMLEEIEWGYAKREPDPGFPMCGSGNA